MLLIPETTEGNGTGHLKRMVRLSGELTGRVYIFIEPSEMIRLNNFLSNEKELNIVDAVQNLNEFEKIIVDKKAITTDFFNKYLKGLNVIAIDEGGTHRQDFPYLIDILPLPKRFGNPNISSLSFLGLKKIKNKNKSNKILVSFGGEDPANLTGILCSGLLEYNQDYISSFLIVLGPLYKGEIPDNQFDIIRNPESLISIIPHYKGIITSFGITAFEAAYAETPVLLFNPTEYHQELSELTGFTSAGVLNIDMDRVVSFIDNPESAGKIEIKPEGYSLSEHINQLDNIDANCPVCNSKGGAVAGRFESRTYFRCERCNMLYLLNYKKGKTIYNKEYFFNQYENQYGKTYLDDFDHLSFLAEKRLLIIKKLCGYNNSILDIGCAYGPFLHKAREMGFSPFGTDISQDAVKYVDGELGIPSVCVEFDKFIFPDYWEVEKVDIITMWYVIEHFQNLSFIFGKINSLLEIGGLFSFSTPSGSGISSKRNFIEYLDNSPEDHYTVWEPGNSEPILDMFGFKILKKRITGHHPERFKSYNPKSKIWKKTLEVYSRIYSLGDTYEIYAEKVRNL